MSSNGEEDPMDSVPGTVHVQEAGEVKSAIMSKEEPVPDELLGFDEDIKVKRVRRGGRTNGILDDEDDADEASAGNTADGADGADLFGDDSDEDAEPKQRQLDDEELDSGDDMERNDRAASGTPAVEQMQEKEELVQYSEFGRQPGPTPSDGEMYLLKVPKFLSIEPTMFDTPSFQVPDREHHSRQEAPPTFSAFNTAMSTVRWRYSPSGSSELQSNARILRWSDGSLTLQFASDPSQQYEIDGNALAPPQKNPVKPNPTSLKATNSQETYTYLTVPHESVGLLRTTHKITAGLSILPSQKTTDDALVRLQSSLAAAVRGKGANNSTGIEMIPVAEDPELMRRQAEMAEREKDRAQKRRLAAENRDRDRTSRTLGRAGLGGSRYGGGGLTAGLLEDDELGAGAPSRPRAKPKPKRNRNDEYSSDEDLGRRRGNFANDDYEVDDFVAGSDEEEDGAEQDSEDEDVDDGIDLSRVAGGKAAGRRRSRDEVEEEEEDADGDDDDDVRAAPKAKRRRAVVDDEDE